MFKVNNKNTRTMSMTSFWCFYCYLWTYFTPFSSASIVNFEQVNVSWVRIDFEKIIHGQEMEVEWDENSSYWIIGKWQRKLLSKPFHCVTDGENCWVFSASIDHADDVLVILNKLIGQGKISENEIFYKFLSQTVHIYYDTNHSYHLNAMECFS